MTGRPESRWATPADMALFYGADVPSETVRARTVTMDDAPVGITGYTLRNGMAFVFSAVTDPLRKHPRFIVREAYRILGEVGNVPTYCTADPDEPTAPRFLEWLGWRHVGRRNGQEVYQWLKP